MEQKKNKFIAIVGMCGSGKSVVADYLVSKDFHFFRFGQITLDEVKKRIGLKSDENLEREIRERNRKTHGMAAYAILNKPKIDKLLKKGNVVGDGLYSWSEYKYLKEIYGDQMIVIAVIAPAEMRYSRLGKRTEIDEKMRSRPMTPESAKSRDYTEIENIEKAGPIAMADIMILNTGTTEELIAELDKKLFKKNKRPTWDEYFIDVMNSVAKRTTCDRARAGGGGCVVVRNKQILVTGYVGSPPGVPHCDEIGHQFKKTLHEDESVTNHCVRTTHAEQNAICQAAKLGIPLEGSTLYCFMAPCYTCAKLIVTSGVKRVVAVKDYHASKDSLELFKKAKVNFEILDKKVQKYSNM